MAIWLLRNPSRIEIQHLIQQHNSLNPAKSQQIPLHLSLEEDFKLKIFQQEQKATKRNFTAVQRSAYSLRRYLEEILKYNAITSTSSCDREICAAATRDFLNNLEAEMEAVESLKIAVERAKILENEQGETEPTTDGLQKGSSVKENEVENRPLLRTEPTRVPRIANVDKVFKAEELPKMDGGVIVKIPGKNSKDALEARVPKRKAQAYNESGSESSANSASFYDMFMSDFGQDPVQPSRTRQSSQDMPGNLDQHISEDASPSTENEPTTPPTSVPRKVLKGILKRLSSFGELPIQTYEQTSPNGGICSLPPLLAESSKHNQYFVPSKRKLHPFLDHETRAKERDRIIAKAQRKAHEKGLELYAEVKGFDSDGTQADMEV